MAEAPAPSGTCWLAVDAATRGAVLVALVGVDGALRAGGLITGEEAALSRAVRDALAAAGAQLGGVVAGHGPGSYTGLPLWTVPSLQVTAWRLDPLADACVVVHAAGRSAHFRQRFLARAGRWVPSAPALWLPRGVDPGEGTAAWEPVVWEPETLGAARGAVRDRLGALARCALAAAGSAKPVAYHEVHAEYGIPWT